jgi:hypothetical protein
MKKKINAQKFLVLFTVLFLGLTSCHKPEDINTEFDDIADIAYTINNNFDDLNNRVSIVREPIENDNTLKTLDTDGDCSDYTWYLVADIASPKFRGTPLSATDVRVLGDKAYVTYHRQGSTYAGAIEILDISDPTAPTILSSMEFDGVDINTLAIDDFGTDAERKIYLAGSSFKKGAILRQVIASDGLLNTDVSDISLSKVYGDDDYISASANGIVFSDDYIYMTSGNSIGGTFQLDRQTLEILANEEYSDAKNVALNGMQSGAYQLSLIAGDEAKLKVHNVGADRDEVNSWDLGVIKHQNVDEPYLGKATLSIREGENIAFIAANERGMIGVDVTSGATVYTSPSDMLSTGNTHGLAIDEKFIYMANSDDGLFIGCIPEDGGEIIEVQRWDLDETGASANMVQTSGDWVFVAKGGGGLKILRKAKNGIYPSVCDWDADGSPTCVEDADLCEYLIADFDVALPSGQNALNNHPEYFENENKEVVLTEAASVSVSFVQEGAGYKNAFGYYTYKVSNPPTSVEDIESSMRIIFANASAAGDGGTLKEGDRVNIGSFEAGTVIGYFVIANGWNGTEVTEGLDTFYSIPALNRGKKQQSLMMYSESCGSLLTAFEDIHISKGDRDYNDIVVKTSIDPMSAMDMASVLAMPSAR